MIRPPLEVADIVRSYGTAFVERHRRWLTFLHLKVLRAGKSASGDAAPRTLCHSCEQCRPPPGVAESFFRALLGQAQGIQWAGGSPHVFLRNVQVAGRGLQTAVAQQQLDGAKVRTGFQQMGGETVAQRMRRNLLGQTGSANGIVKSPPQGVAADGLVRVFAWKEPSRRFLPPPVLSQHCE